MAEQKVILAIGSSNMAGFGALLDDVPLDDMTRWVGAGGVHPPLPSPTSAQLPYHVSVGGCRVLTPRRPYSTNISRPINGSAAAGGNTLDYSGGASGAIADSWVYIRVNSTGQGLLKRVTADSGVTVTIDGTWGTAVANDGTIHFLQDAFTFSSINAARTVITKTAGPDFTSAVVGRDVVFFGNDVVRRVTAFAGDTITIDAALGSDPAANSGFCILTGANSCETMADLANPAKCALLDLQFYIDKNAPVYLTGFDYGNYDQTPFQNPRTAFLGPTTINCIWELQWQMRTRLGNAPIVLIVMGISASMVSPFLQSKVQGPAPIVSFGGFIGWFHDLQSLDFHPSSPNSIYTALTNCITCTKALLAAESNTASFQSCNINLSDNDPSAPVRVDLIGNNFTLLRDALRAQTSPQMLWLMAGPARYAPPETTRQHVYDQLEAIEADDPRSGVFDTRGFLVPQDFFAADLLHFSALGQIKLGQGFPATWDTTHVRANDASRLTAELPTLATLRTRVRRRYERTATGNDGTAAQIDMFLNDSIRELYNTLGDEKAWFLRRIEEVDIEGGTYPNTITLPRTVKRLLRIETGTRPGYALAWKGIGYTDEGRTQIALHNAVSGPYLLHFVTLTKDLLADTDVAIVPEEYVELVVVLTCKRLVECAGNQAMAIYYAAEAERLWRVVKRSCQLHDRIRQGQMEPLNTFDATTNSVWTGGDEWGLF